MKRLCLGLAVMVLFVWVQNGVGDRPSHGDDFWKDIIPGEVIVGYTNDVDVYKASPTELGLADKGVSIKSKSLPKLNFVVVNVPGALEETKKFVKLMEQEPHVKYVEPHRWMYIHFTPDDPQYGSQYDKPQMNCEAAWDLGLGDMSISVAIVDQGAQYTHPDLAAHYGTYKGYDYFSNDPDPIPESTSESHGTHTSGIAGAVINNATGIAGVANVRLLSYRCGSASNLSSAALANSLQECADSGWNIISNSWGGGADAAIRNAIQNAWNAGCLILASSGNSGTSGVSNPAAYPEVIAVGALNSSDQKASFSTYGPELELIAGGVQVLSTIPFDNYGPMSGTSMSCPNAAGGAALVWSANPSLTNVEVRGILCSTAVDLGTAGRDDYYGYGKPDLFAAVESAGGGGGGAGEISVYNHKYACDSLVVTNITWNASWITSAEPSSFTLAPGDSQGVLIKVTAAGLTPGQEYHDNLLISSNDPDDNPFTVPVTLRVGGSKEGGESKEQISKLLTLKCYPNPVMRTVTIIYTLTASGNVALTIYDISGRKVKTILDEKANSGTYFLNIETKELTPGIYFISLGEGDRRVSQKITLAR